MTACPQVAPGGVVTGVAANALRAMVYDKFGHEAVQRALEQMPAEHVRDFLRHIPPSAMVPEAASLSMLGALLPAQRMPLHDFLFQFGQFLLSWLGERSGYSRSIHRVASTFIDFVRCCNGFILQLFTTAGNVYNRMPHISIHSVTGNSCTLMLCGDDSATRMPILQGMIQGIATQVFGTEVQTQPLPQPAPFRHLMRVTAHVPLHEVVQKPQYRKQPKAVTAPPPLSPGAAQMAMGLDPETFYELFPFHFVMDKSWRLLQTGAGLKKVMPELATPGTQVNELLTIVHPMLPWNAELLEVVLEHSHTSRFLLRKVDDQLDLKGGLYKVKQMRRQGGPDGPLVQGEEVLVFLGSPMCFNFEEMSKHQLYMSDFAAHDMGADFILMANHRQVKIHDLEKTAERLQEERQCNSALKETLAETLAAQQEGAGRPPLQTNSAVELTVKLLNSLILREEVDIQQVLYVRDALLKAGSNLWVPIDFDTMAIDKDREVNEALGALLGASRAKDSSDLDLMTPTRGAYEASPSNRPTASLLASSNPLSGSIGTNPACVKTRPLVKSTSADSVQMRDFVYASISHLTGLAGEDWGIGGPTSPGLDAEERGRLARRRRHSSALGLVHEDACYSGDGTQAAAVCVRPPAMVAAVTAAAAAASSSVAQGPGQGLPAAAAGQGPSQGREQGQGSEAASPGGASPPPENAAATDALLCPSPRPDGSSSPVEPHPRHYLDPHKDQPQASVTPTVTSDRQGQQGPCTDVRLAISNHGDRVEAGGARADGADGAVVTGGVPASHHSAAPLLITGDLSVREALSVYAQGSLSCKSVLSQSPHLGLRGSQCEKAHWTDQCPVTSCLRKSFGSHSQRTSTAPSLADSAAPHMPHMPNAARAATPTSAISTFMTKLQRKLRKRFSFAPSRPHQMGRASADGSSINSTCSEGPAVPAHRRSTDTIATATFPAASLHQRSKHPLRIVLLPLKAANSGLQQQQQNQQNQQQRHLVRVMYEPSDELTAVLTGVDEWQFDAFALERASNGHPLSCLAFFLFKRMRLAQQLQLSESRLVRFLMRIEEGYPDNSYHCRTHAADVLRTFHTVLTRGGVLDTVVGAAKPHPAQHGQTQSTHGGAASQQGGVDVDSLAVPIKLLSCYLSAIIHDYEHRGVNNDFLVRTSDPLALLYNDMSPLEHHHVSAAFMLMRDEQYAFFPASSKRMQDVVRKTTIELVLATDMKQHFSMMGLFNSKLGGDRRGQEQDLSSLSGTGRVPSDASLQRGLEGAASRAKGPMVPLAPAWDAESRMLALKMALKCSDLGHLASSIEVHKVWVARLEEEMFRQGDQERALGQIVSPLMDRNKAGVTRSQCGFFSVVALPMYQSFAQVFPSTEQLHANVRGNNNYWKVVEEHSSRLESHA